MSFEIGPQTIKGEAEYHYEQQQRRVRSRNSFDRSFGGALFGIGIMIVSFFVIREAFLVLWTTVVEFWDALPF